MALDLYSGPFTRYCTRNWENVARAMCREQGIEYRVVSSHRLLAELKALNESTWNQNSNMLMESVQQEDLSKKPLEPCAKIGLVYFLAAAEWSVQENLPLLLDY